MGRLRACGRLAATLGLLALLLPVVSATALTGACHVVSRPGFFDELTVADPSDTDPATNEVTMGSIGTLSIESVAVRPSDSKLVGIDYDQLGAIDTTSAAWSPMPSVLGSGNGPLGSMTFQDVDGVGYHPVTGELFAIVRGTEPELLVKVDQVSGAADPNGFGPGQAYVPITLPGGYPATADVTELAFDPATGSAYAVLLHSVSSANLVSLDVTTGVTADAGPLGTDVTALSYGPGGLLYALTGDGQVFSVGTPGTVTLDNSPNYRALACIAGGGPPNQPPTPSDDSVNTPEDTLVVVAPLANDTDPDGDPLTIWSFTQGANGTVTDNGDGTLDYDPDQHWNGVDTFTYEADDGKGGRTPAAVTVTVSPQPDPPAFDPVADQSAAEDSPWSLGVTATDPDGDPLTLIQAGAPAWAAFVDNGDGTASFSGSPGYDDAGSHSITVTALDGTHPVDEIFTLTVDNTNRAPVVDPLDDAGVAEGNPWTLAVSATDADGDPIALSEAGAPGWAAFVDHGDGTATLSGTPGYADAGSHAITITATDGADPGTEQFTLTVTNTNRSPSIDPLADRSTPEKSPVTFTATGSDPDGDPLTFSLSGAPPGATITAGGAFSWTPSEAQGPGAYTFDVVVDDGGTPLLGDSTTLTVTVAEVADPPQAVDDLVSGGAAQQVWVAANDTDPDDGLDLASATISIPPANGSAWLTSEVSGPLLHFQANPGFTGRDSLVYRICDYGSLCDLATVTIDVVDGAPAIDPVPAQAVAEADPWSLTVTATDPEAGAITWTDSGTPAWASFVDNGDGTAGFSGTPGYDDAGAHTITVFAGDGTNTSSHAFSLTVTDTNRAPTVVPLGDSSVAEGDPWTVTATATDADGDALTLSQSGLPGWAVLVDHGNGTATLSGNPGYQDAGAHTVTVFADDGQGPVGAAFTLTVTNTNRVPSVQALANQAVAEGDPWALLATASDADGDPLAITQAGLPAWAALVDHGDGTATLSGTPGYDDAGTHTLTVFADDGHGPVGETFTLTVTDTNRAPTVHPLADANVAEGSRHQRTVVATDPDGDPLTFSLVAGPPGAAVDPDTGVVSWTPGEAEGPGAYVFSVAAADPHGSRDTSSYLLSVAEVNAAPTVLAPPSQTSGVGDSVDVAITATDVDLPANTLTFSAAGLPPGVAVDPTGGRITGTLPPGSAGSYAVTVTVTDDGSPPGQAQAGFTWEVVDTNGSPVVAPLGPFAHPEDQPFAATLAATDPDGDLLTFALAGGPPGAAVDASSGEVTWTPSEADGPGTASVTVDVTDDGTPPLTTRVVVDIHVAEVNRPPQIDAQPDRVTQAGVPVSDQVTATDPDLPANTLTYSATGLPAGVHLDPATGALTGAAGAFGTYAVYLEVRDGAGGRASAAFTWQVRDGNSPPVLAPLGAVESVEGAPLQVDLAASDPDGDPLGFTASGLPAWAALTDHGDGTAAIAGTPGYEASGLSVVVVSVSDGEASATGAFRLVIADVNRPPVATADTFVVTGPGGLDVLGNDSDPDGDELQLAAVGPTEAGGIVKVAGDEIRYRPRRGFAGEDAFTYTVTDGAGGTAAARVAVTVRPPPPASSPVIQDDGGAVRVLVPVEPDSGDAGASDAGPTALPAAPSVVAEGGAGRRVPAWEPAPDGAEPPTVPAAPPGGGWAAAPVGAGLRDGEMAALRAETAAHNTEPTVRPRPAARLTPRRGLAVAFRAAVEMLRDHAVAGVVLGVLIAWLSLRRLDDRAAGEAATSGGTAS